MSRVKWDDLEVRLYQVGVDRGMLYGGGVIPVGVPWNGLVNITESPDGGQSQPFFLDGRMIQNTSSGEDFKATIEAFYAPLEFAPCNGLNRLSTGLFAGEQPKESFGFSYRTLVGNIASGTSFAYRIHVVYNAKASQGSYIYATVTDSPSFKTYSWEITTSPIEVPGRRPSAHFIFDTRVVSTDSISGLEDILYGTDFTEPRIPTVSELIALLSS